MVSSSEMEHNTQCLQPADVTPRQPSAAESREDLNPRPDKSNKWNHPRSNIIRVLTTFWVFFVMGANDAAYGLEEYYSIPYMVVSLVFLSPLVGYVLAALVNNKLHMALGQRGVALIAPACHLIAYIISCIHPPYPVLVVAYIFAGIANGLHEAAWNTYIGSLENPNELLGLLHGVYGLGAVISPLVATNMITKAKIGISVIEAVACPVVFWRFTGTAFQQSHEQSHGDPGEQAKSGLRDALFTRPAARVSWLSSFVLLFYVGVEVTIGGWIVTIMMEVRHAAPFPSGMTATGFWLGITAGRVVLGFVTARLGEKLATTIYITCAIACALVVWLVPNFYVSAVVVSIQGFFLGPLFPCVVAVITKLLPKNLHVAAIGFVAAFGGAGAAVIPFVAGGIAQGSGVKSLLPFVVGVSAGILLLWLGLPRLRKGGAQQ
ncbi:putative bypass of stop codon protein [Aspergillus nomiae NRRL 13137]|uniref:Putative bypass of stop codon protein n=1 Tax=Aspergillus nomiae NRRL (strain ATCC 15546 / NRRL 13137 / CBS 260.88 / M93) TaxID=1509407 RepID=A0A0L1J8J1_ASPN3|nr:putative bypass of stop codon protein [Aspergillus nomiae NRRL 13137]KNG88062.1 putative bypass of stop codon protein [Aspergillus nomiae NRRL 13137]